MSIKQLIEENQKLIDKVDRFFNRDYGLTIGSKMTNQDLKIENETNKI